MNALEACLLSVAARIVWKPLPNYPLNIGVPQADCTCLSPFVYSPGVQVSPSALSLPTLFSILHWIRPAQPCLCVIHCMSYLT